MSESDFKAARIEALAARRARPRPPLLTARPAGVKSTFGVSVPDGANYDPWPLLIEDDRYDSCLLGYTDTLEGGERTVAIYVAR